MSDPLVYDSRSVRFKSPYGAVPSGTQVTFTLRPLRSEGYSRGKLTARLELEESAASSEQKLEEWAGHLEASAAAVIGRMAAAVPEPVKEIAPQETAAPDEAAADPAEPSASFFR